MNQDINQRVKQVVRWLIGTGYADSQEGIGQLLGYNNKSSFSQVLNNPNKMPLRFIERLINLCPQINRVWLETGEGEMIINNKPAEPSDHIKKLNHYEIYDEMSIQQMFNRLIDQLEKRDELALRQQETQKLQQETVILQQREHEKQGERIDRLISLLENLQGQNEDSNIGYAPKKRNAGLEDRP